MSLRYQNSCAERSQLRRLIALSAKLLEEDSDDDDGMALDSVDSSFSLESVDSLDAYLSTSSSDSTVAFVVGETIRLVNQYVDKQIFESEISFSSTISTVDDDDDDDNNSNNTNNSRSQQLLRRRLFLILPPLTSPHLMQLTNSSTNESFANSNKGLDGSFLDDGSVED